MGRGRLNINGYPFTATMGNSTTEHIWHVHGQTKAMRSTWPISQLLPSIGLVWQEWTVDESKAAKPVTRDKLQNIKLKNYVTEKRFWMQEHHYLRHLYRLVRSLVTLNPLAQLHLQGPARWLTFVYLFLLSEWLPWPIFRIWTAL